MVTFATLLVQGLAEKEYLKAGYHDRILAY